MTITLQKLIFELKQKFAHFEDELDRIVMLLRRGQLLPACRKSIQTIADINSYSPSSLHWIYPAAWKHIRDAFSSAARNSMQRGQSSSHPEVSSSLLYSGCSQLLDAMWTQQIYCIISGHTSLENASIAQTLSSTSSFFSDQPPSLDEVKGLIDGMMNDNTNMWPTAPSIVVKIFQAGQDLLLLGTLNSYVARLYNEFSVPTLPSLSSDQRSWATLLIETNGRTNEFPNSLLMV